jgi:hypothetical protein
MNPRRRRNLADSGRATVTDPTATAALTPSNPDGPADFAITITAAEGEDLTWSTTKDIEVQNVAPLPSISGGYVTEGRPYVLSLCYEDSGDDRAHTWLIDWGDGTDQQYIPHPIHGATHTFDSPSTQIQAWVTDEDGTWEAPAKSLTLKPAPPTSQSFTFDSTGALNLHWTNASTFADGLQIHAASTEDGDSYYYPESTDTSCPRFRGHHTYLLEHPRRLAAPPADPRPP